MISSIRFVRRPGADTVISRRSPTRKTLPPRVRRNRSHRRRLRPPGIQTRTTAATTANRDARPWGNSPQSGDGAQFRTRSMPAPADLEADLPRALHLWIERRNRLIDHRRGVLRRIEHGYRQPMRTIRQTGSRYRSVDHLRRGARLLPIEHQRSRAGVGPHRHATASVVVGRAGPDRAAVHLNRDSIDAGTGRGEGVGATRVAGVEHHVSRSAGVALQPAAAELGTDRSRVGQEQEMGARVLGGTVPGDGEQRVEGSADELRAARCRVAQGLRLFAYRGRSACTTILRAGAVLDGQVVDRHRNGPGSGDGEDLRGVVAGDGERAGSKAP